MSVIVSVENGKVCNQATMRKRLEGFGEVLIVDKMDDFGQDFVEKAKRGFRSTTPETWELYSRERRS